MSGYTLGNHDENHYPSIHDPECVFCRDEALQAVITKVSGGSWVPSKNHIDAITALLQEEYGCDILPVESGAVMLSHVPPIDDPIVISVGQSCPDCQHPLSVHVGTDGTCQRNLESGFQCPCVRNPMTGDD